MDYLKLLANGSKQLNIDLSRLQIEQLGIYLKQLREFNSRFNLTFIIEPADIVIKHFLDSLSLLSTGYVVDGKSLVDIGSGAGFPGLVLKIALPSLKLTLLESNRKKTLFMQHMIEMLSLNETQAQSLRAEDFGQTNHRGQFDLVTSRALSSLATSLEYAIPLLKNEGMYLAMKAKLENEPSTKKACQILGCRFVETKKVEVPYLEAERNIVIYKKVSSTPNKYPRKPGTPAKNPLV